MRSRIPVKVEVIHPEAKLPVYARYGDAGADIVAVEHVVICPGSTVVVKTGLKVAVPYGYEIQIRPRSGLSLKSTLRIANAPGTIDSGYRDEVGVIMTNTGSDPYAINVGDRIAQMVIAEVPEILWLPVGNIADEMDRGGGLGHTGR